MKVTESLKAFDIEDRGLLIRLADYLSECGDDEIKPCRRLIHNLIATGISVRKSASG